MSSFFINIISLSLNIFYLTIKEKMNTLFYIIQYGIPMIFFCLDRCTDGLCFTGLCVGGALPRRPVSVQRITFGETMSFCYLT